MSVTTPSGRWQTPGDEIDIAEWLNDEEYPFFPEGSRDKRLLHCPMPAPQPWLVAGHRYLFKKSRPVYPEQFWAEIVASRLSSLTGVAVPPAYAAWDSRNNECAALIEWFWGYPGGPVQHFLSGGLFMKAMMHNPSLLREWCRCCCRSITLRAASCAPTGVVPVLL